MSMDEGVGREEAPGLRCRLKASASVALDAAAVDASSQRDCSDNRFATPQRPSLSVTGTRGATARSHRRPAVRSVYPLGYPAGGRTRRVSSATLRMNTARGTTPGDGVTVPADAILCESSNSCAVM